MRTTKSIISYLQGHPLTFLTTSRTAQLKPKQGLSKDGIIYSHLWGHYYITIGNKCYAVSYNTYKALLTNQIKPTLQEGPFTFYAGFEDSKEGKLLRRRHDDKHLEKVIARTRDLFDWGLVESYLTDWVRYITAR